MSLGVVSRPASRARATRRPPPSARQLPRRRPGAGRVQPLVALTIGVVACGVAGTGAPTWWAVPLAFALLVLGATISAAPAVARTRWASAPGEAVLAMALSLAPGAWIAPVMASAVLLTQLLRAAPGRRATTALTRAFAAAGVAAAVAAEAAHLGDGHAVAAGVGMLAWWATGHTLAVLAVARLTGRRVRSLMRSRAAVTFPGVALGTAVGLTFGWLALQAPAGLVGLAAPLLLVIATLQNDARQTAESRALAELVRSAGGGRTLDDAAQLVVTAAARLLGGADVDLVLVGAGDLVRYSGREHGRASRSRVTLTALDDPWVARTLSRRQGVSPEGTGAARRGRDAGRAVLAVPLGATGSPVAALIARRPGSGASFTRDEALLADALATQTAAWLPRAADLPDPGAGAGAELPLPRPVAELLHSANRLAGLAVPAVDTDAVVDELRALEAAVAGLFGTDAGAGRVERRRQSTEDPGAVWTTSGVLP